MTDCGDAMAVWPRDHLHARREPDDNWEIRLTNISALPMWLTDDAEFAAAFRPAADLEELLAKAKRAVDELANLFECMDNGACARNGNIGQFHLDVLALAGDELRSALRKWDEQP